MDVPFVELFARAAAGDGGAVDDLFRAYLPAIRSMVRLHATPALLARESSDDLAQSVCREVLQSLDGFRDRDDEHAFQAFLCTLALRKIQDRHRRNLAGKRDVRREVRADEQSAWGEACAVFATPSGEAMAHEAEARLDAAFLELSEQERFVVIQARFLDVPHKQIAAEIGKSEAATRQTLARALAKLAEAVD